MRREWKTLIGGLAIAAICTQCGQEDKQRSKDNGTSNQAQAEEINSADSGAVPSVSVDNEAAIQSEYDALPEAIVEEVPLDENGEELASAAQFRSYNGDSRPRNSNDAYGHYQHGQQDHRVQNYRSQYGNNWQQGGYNQGGYNNRGGSYHHQNNSHHNRQHYDRGSYHYRPHYQSNVYNRYNWVYGNPYRYQRGQVAIYWYPKPSYRYQNGTCYNYYQPAYPRY